MAIDDSERIQEMAATLLRIEELLVQQLQQQTALIRTLSILVGSAQHGR